MKENQFGFSVILGSSVLLVLVLIGGVGWYVWQANGKSENSLSNTTGTEKSAADATENTLRTKEEEKIPAGYIKYHNQELGISFVYPTNWGEVVKADFDNKGNSDYFKFTKFDGLTLGGLESDYAHPGRGGSLIDYGGYIQSNDNFQFRSRTDKSPNAEAAGYQLNTPRNCIFSTGVEFFDKPAYHAVCNLNNSETFGFNFAVYDTSEVTTSQFLVIVNSVSIE